LSGDLSQVLRETTSDGQDTWYMYGLDLIGQQKNGTWSYFGYDALGSVRFLTDASGQVTSRADYDPYGNPIQALSASFGFTGEMTDPLGQIYLRARYYDPGLGVFTSLDPVEGMLGRSASYNGYGYVEGNPTNDGVGELSHQQNTSVSVSFQSGCTFADNKKARNTPGSSRFCARTVASQATCPGFESPYPL
jgi:RHS repeat-associated protein